MAQNPTDLEKRIEELEKRLAEKEKQSESVPPPLVAAQQTPEKETKHPSAFAYIGVFFGIVMLLNSVPGLIFSIIPRFFSSPNNYGYGYNDPSIYWSGGVALLGAFLVWLGMKSIRSNKTSESSKTTQTTTSVASFGKTVAKASNGKEQTFEFKVVSQWFAVVGIVAVIAGVGYFLKYAFDNDIIGPTGQVVIGIIFGLSFLGTGEFLRSKYPRYSFIISGGGIVVLYLSLWASYAIFSLTGQITTLAGMSAITVTASLLAIRYEVLPIAILGVLGGYATPLMLAKGFDDQLILMAYLVILNLGVLTVAIFKNWHKLNILSFIGTYAVFFTWYARYYNVSQLWTTFIFLTILFLIFGLVMFVYNVINSKKTEDTDVLMMIGNALVYFGVCYKLFHDPHYSYIGFLALILAVFYFFLGYISFNKFRQTDDALTLGFIGISILFLTIAVPLEVKKNIITIIWSLEGVVILWLAFWIPSYKIRVLGLGILSLVVMRLIAYESHLPLAEFTLIFNVRFLTYIIAALGMGAAAYIYKTYKATATATEVHIMAILIIALNVILVAAFSQEATSYFDKKIDSIINSQRQTNAGQTYVLAAQSIVVPIASKEDVISIGCPAFGQAINLGYLDSCPSTVSITRFNFKNVRIPRNAKIDSAYVAFNVYGTSNDSTNLSVNVDPDFYGGASYKYGAYPWILNTPWSNKQVVKTPDLSLLLQSLVDSPSWVGGAGQVSVNVDSLRQVANRWVYSVEGGATIAPRLLVTFDATGATEAVAAPTFPSNSVNYYSSPSPYNYGSRSPYAPASYLTPAAQQQVKNMQSQRDVSLSIIWGIYSILLIILGIVIKYRPIRLAALVFFAFTILKVFLYDSQYLQTQYRIVAFIGLGAILLAISLIYQKYKEKIGEFLK